LKYFTDAELEQGMSLSERYLLRIRDVSGELGARCGVVWLPASYGLSRHPPTLPLQRALQDRIERAGIPSIDLMPVVLREPEPAGLYIPSDGHFSVRGHRVAGQAIAQWILDQGLVNFERE
jgi:hypothetical protein